MAVQKVKLTTSGNWRARLRVWIDLCPGVPTAGVSVDVEEKIDGEWLAQAPKAITGLALFRGATGMMVLGKDFELPLHSENSPHASVDLWATPSGVFKDSGTPIGTAPFDIREVIASGVKVHLPFLGERDSEISFVEDVSANKTDPVECVNRYFKIIGFPFVELAKGIASWISEEPRRLCLVRFIKTGFPLFKETKIRLPETSTEQLSMHWAMDRLYIAWTGTDDDHRINVLTALATGIEPTPESTTLSKVLLGKSNDDAGPAVVSARGRTVVAWQDDDDHIRMVAGHDGRSFHQSLDPGRLHSESAPALATDGNRLFVGYAAPGRDSIRLRYTRDADWGNWESLDIREAVGGDGGVALAYGVDSLFVAWTGRDDESSLNVMRLLDNGSTVEIGEKTTLNEQSSDDANPSLAFAEKTLYLAWTGSNDSVNFMSSDDFGRSFGQKTTLGQKSFDNAGPAIVAAAGGEVIIGWLEE